MKKFVGVVVVLALVVFFSAFPAFGDIVNPAPVKKELSSMEKITRLGFPSEVTASLTQMIEQGKFVEKVPLKNGIKVSLAIRGQDLCQKCSFSWPAHQNSPEREKYVFGEYELFVIKNRNGDIFYRNDLPTAKVAEKATPPKEIPQAEKPLPVIPISKEIPKTEKSLVAEQKSFAPAPKAITEAEKPLLTSDIPAPSVALEKKRVATPNNSSTSSSIQKTEGNGVERVYEATALPLSLKNIENQPMTAIMIPIYKSPWIGDGLGTYTVTEKDGKEVQVNARFAEDKIPNLTAIQNLQILNTRKQPVFIKDVAKVELKPSVEKITRIDQKKNSIVICERKQR
jgi:hypothetical protein